MERRRSTDLRSPSAASPRLTSRNSANGQHFAEHAEPLLCQQTVVQTQSPDHWSSANLRGPERAPLEGPTPEELATTGGACRELATLGKLAAPLVVQNLAGYTLSIVAAMAVGHLNDPVALSSVVLAGEHLGCSGLFRAFHPRLKDRALGGGTCRGGAPWCGRWVGAGKSGLPTLCTGSLYNVTGWSFIIGLSAGMETLCGQAYGAGQYKVLGLILQRALLICWAACVPITLGWSYAPQLLTALHQQPDIMQGAARWVA
jgi:Na+-driven multidrug efflux pump